MEKAKQITAIATGIMLGGMALVLISFYKFEKQIADNMLLEKQIKEELILKVKTTCSPSYSVVKAAIYKGKIVIECRNE